MKAILISIGVLALLASLGGWFLFDTYKTAISAEQNLQAEWVVMKSINEFVNRENRWPSSWADLASTEVKNSGMIRWPDDVDEIRSFITVNFAFNIEDLNSGKVRPEDILRSKSSGYLHLNDYVNELKNTWNNRGERQ